MGEHLIYEMSSEAIARAAAHRLRELGADVTLPRQRAPGTRLTADVPDDHAAEADRLILGLDPDAVSVSSR